MTDVIHNGRVTDRTAGPNDDLEAVFAEAEAKAVERDGLALEIAGRTFEVWPARFTHRQKMKIHSLAGMTVEGAAGNLESAPLEAMATLVLASMAQTSGRYPSLDGIEAWLRQVVTEASGDEVPVGWRTLRFDEAVESDPLGL
jgi:hypothetical protein